MKKQSSKMHKRRRHSSMRRRLRRGMRIFKRILLYFVLAVLLLAAPFVYMTLKGSGIVAKPSDDIAMRNNVESQQTLICTTIAPEPSVYATILPTVIPARSEIAMLQATQSITNPPEQVVHLRIASSELPTQTIDASSEGTAWITEGRLHIVGENLQGIDVSTWKDLRSVSLGETHVVAVDMQNRAWAAGENRMGQCAVNGLENVNALTVGMECTVALMQDGTVRSFGSIPEDWALRIFEEENVVQVDMSDTHLILLHEDGTALVCGEAVSVEAWHNLKMVAAGNNYVIGLTDDGRLLLSGTAAELFQEALQWTDIVQICAGSSHIAAIRSDGSTVAIGRNSSGQCDVSDWKEISCISAGYDHTVAMDMYGQAMAVGYQNNGQCDVY